MALHLITDKAPVPIHPDTNSPVERHLERVDCLLKDLQKRKIKIAIPTPVLSEILVRVDNSASQYLAKFKSSAAFQIAHFDELAAIEVAYMAKQEVKPRQRTSREATIAKLKYDRQIVAIAKVIGATMIYSDDKGVRALGRRYRMSISSIWDLPLPDAVQTDLLDLLNDQSTESTLTEKTD
jgi:hypothetical protein